MEQSRIVVGRIRPMLAADMRNHGRQSARHGGRGAVDIAYARDLAERRSGPAAEAAIGRQLLNLGARGGDVTALAKAMNEMVELADGVKSGSPSPRAVATANRLITPESVASLNGLEGATDLLVLAYAVLHFDEVRALNGGLS